MNWLIKILISSFAVMIASYIIPGVNITDYITGILVAIVLSLLNTFLKPFLIIFTIPITLFTLGLFLVVINAAIILLASDIVEGFAVSGFWSALFFSIAVSIITSILLGFDKQDEK